MEINIKVLDVGDGDAIIVHLKEENRQLVFLIDGGRKNNVELVRESLEVTLKEANKRAPDFILCSHYDDDHIGGLAEILSYYSAHKPDLWMFNTTEKIDIEELSDALTKIDYREKSIYPSEEDTYAGGSVGTENLYELAIKTVEQEQKLNKLANDLGINCREPLVETFNIKDWPELELISPSINLYKKLFPKKFTVNKLIEETVLELKNNEYVNDEKNHSKDPFENLDKIVKSRITQTNINSAVLLLTAAGKKFLFTADAGIESFQNMPLEKLEKLYWLKIPHHGSANNLSSELIKTMSPAHAVISGKRHISAAVVACFKMVGSDLQTTEQSGNINFKFP